MVMLAPVALITLGGDVLGGKGEHTHAVLRYSDETAISALEPPEGHYEGGQTVRVVGTFESLLDEEIEVAFGGQVVTEILE